MSKTTPKIYQISYQKSNNIICKINKGKQINKINIYKYINTLVVFYSLIINLLCVTIIIYL